VTANEAGSAGDQDTAHEPSMNQERIEPKSILSTTLAKQNRPRLTVRPLPQDAIVRSTIMAS
jgi:hypothetical protein